MLYFTPLFYPNSFELYKSLVVYIATTNDLKLPFSALIRYCSGGEWAHKLDVCRRNLAKCRLYTWSIFSHLSNLFRMSSMFYRVDDLNSPSTAILGCQIPKRKASLYVHFSRSRYKQTSLVMGLALQIGCMFQKQNSVRSFHRFKEYLTSMRIVFSCIFYFC